jgi:hypothetical protein
MGQQLIKKKDGSIDGPGKTKTNAWAMDPNTFFFVLLSGGSCRPMARNLPTFLLAMTPAKRMKERECSTASVLFPFLAVV